MHPYNQVPCPECEGIGRIAVYGFRHPQDAEPGCRPCEECWGTGLVDDHSDEDEPTLEVDADEPDIYVRLAYADFIKLAEGATLAAHRDRSLAKDDARRRAAQADLDHIGSIIAGVEGSAARGRVA